MEMNKSLNDEELNQVVGGTCYRSLDSVQFGHQVGETISFIRHSDGATMTGIITDRGIEKVSETKYYACYYVEIQYYLGTGWLHDDGGINFENRVHGTVIQSGL